LTYQFAIRDSEFEVGPRLSQTARQSLNGEAADRVSLSERAYYVIRERILKGEIALGAPLSRRRLALELGMSLLPVAEALQSLESDGLVESRPRVGTRVCLPSADEICDRYQIREALESQAARLYAQKASLRERRTMEKMAEHMDDMFNRSAAGTGHDRDFLYAVHSYHLELHLRIAEFARSRELRAMIEKNHVLIFNWLFDIAASRPPLPPRFHRDLVRALNGGKPETADRAMRKHVRFGVATVVDKIGPRANGVKFERVKEPARQAQSLYHKYTTDG
jgi:DNA-binding GntR family transcriptional regulator